MRIRPPRWTGSIARVDVSAAPGRNVVVGSERSSDQRAFERAQTALTWPPPCRIHTTATLGGRPVHARVEIGLRPWRRRRLRPSNRVYPRGRPDATADSARSWSRPCPLLAWRESGKSRRLRATRVGEGAWNRPTAAIVRSARANRAAVVPANEQPAHDQDCHRHRRGALNRGRAHNLLGRIHYRPRRGWLRRNKTAGRGGT